MLIVFGGLPGTGKTTISRELARRRGAVWLRIDTIEGALRRAGTCEAEAGISAYGTAQSLAVDNLRLGRTVVADCVNPVAASRRGWAGAAAEAAARMIAVHVTCSDAAGHRRRVETRVADIVGQAPVTWADVLGEGFEPWPDADLTIDTAHLAPADAVAALETALDRLTGSPP